MDHAHDTDFSKLVNLYPVKILSLISTPAFSLNAFVDKPKIRFHTINQANHGKKSLVAENGCRNSVNSAILMELQHRTGQVL